MPEPPANRLKFPRLERVKLSRFSLYSLNPNPDIALPPGVFCLAGANGLGKTTFLTTLNYALTGIVVDPARDLSGSIEEYFRYSQTFSSDYFSGRIDEEDREAAAVELRFSLGLRSYRIVRGLFEPSGLRELTVTRRESVDAQATNSEDVDGQTMTAGERLEMYEQLVVEDVGVRSFAQFAFLQHFVFTFDESRRLLFWDRRALEQALFLAFGADYEIAQRADSLRREVERQDSIVRNFNWRASGIRVQLKALVEAVNTAENPAADALAREEHEIFQREFDKCREKLDAKDAEVSDVELAIMEESSERTSLQAEYARRFAERVHKRSRVELHPLIRSTLTASECSVCGTAGNSIVSHIRGVLDGHRCPLCESPLQPGFEEEGVAQRLRKIDERLVRAELLLTEAHQRRDRLRAEREAAVQQLRACEEQLREWEAANSETLKRLLAPPSGVEEKIMSLRTTMEDYLSTKDQAFEQRNRARAELRRSQEDLQVSYAEAEEHFVPLFQDLAFLFIGIDLDIRLDASASLSGGLSLVIELRSSKRRQSHQLSESQRFFLDIALRMALARYISDRAFTAPMMIDTPEGSLDIAYESRAGQMFAKFVRDGHDLLMTANINSSQLLLQLAAECGKDQMKLQRMTAWAQLSEVQVKEQNLFDEAYDRIEAALSEGVDVARP